MIGARQGNQREVSGAGGSCFYRAVAYQMCEREGRPYADSVEVAMLRRSVREYLHKHRNEPVGSDRAIRWKDIGSYSEGYAEAPVPQAMPYVLQRPLLVHLGRTILRYGTELSGEPVRVRLQGQHYSIQYAAAARAPARDSVYGVASGMSCSSSRLQCRGSRYTK